jgi:hypothetical protein
MFGVKKSGFGYTVTSKTLLVLGEERTVPHNTDEVNSL